VFNQERGVVRVKVLLFLSGQVYHLRRRNAQKLHHVFELLLLVVAGEQRFPSAQLCQDAAQGPDIYFGRVRNSENNLRGSVESALNIGVNLVWGQTATTEVHYFKRLSLGVAKKYIFGLQITVNDLAFL